MHSYQMAVGLYSQLDKHWFASLEGYYKLSHHMLQYASYGSLTPPAKYWDNFVIEGKGKFYGIEADVRYHNQRLSLDASYTLSWNKRYFKDFYPEWFYDKFDNRHKFNITGRMKLSDKVEMYAGWVYHTGYRTTVPTQITKMPDVPYGNYNYSIQVDYNYDQPNNIIMPAYHRLDLGLNIHHTTKAGHERIWNISVYNAYCRLNPLYTDIKQKSDGSVYLHGQGFIPIIPTASYTIKF